MNTLPLVRERTAVLKEHANLIILIIAAITATVIFFWQAYITRSPIIGAEKSALMSTLFLTDMIVLVVSLPIGLLALYLASLHFGDLRGTQYDTLSIFIIAMVVPPAFIGCVLAFNPPGLELHSVTVGACLSGMGLIASILFIFYCATSVQPKTRIDRLIDQIVTDFRKSGLHESATSITAQQPLISPAALGLINLLKKLSASDDAPAVKTAIDSMASTIIASIKTDDMKKVALARCMVCGIVQIGAIGAETRNSDVVCHAITRLKDLTIQCQDEDVSPMAFRGIGYVYGSCVKYGDCISITALDPWMAGIYAAVYDGTGLKESLDRAVMTADRAAMRGDILTIDESAHTLFMAGQVYRRLAESANNKSGDKALQAITMLEQALNTNTQGPIDSALVSAEIGRSYVSLAACRNPVKNYKKALNAFESAYATLTPETFPWDAARLEADIGNANVLLASEYQNLRRYDDALTSARSAIEHYSVASKFFTRGHFSKDNGRIMSDTGLAHTIISEIFLRSRELDSALNHVSMAIDCYSMSARSIDRAEAPEAYASIRVSMGLAYASMAEICFKEKRFEDAISACDSAIQAYNEAAKIYQGAGKDRLAAATRRNLKKATDLFNTFMMIGRGKEKTARSAV
ncbi:MAG TPA: hypothetical protein VK436_05315 [Methanocella sp.]|nr:hypothetical protein [Methanocella sp.]